jgi:hypothetical protein
MFVQHIGSDFFAEIYLGFAILAQVPLEFDDIEIEMVECGTHAIEPVFRFHNQLVIAMRVRPFFLLLCQGAITSLAAPFFTGSTDPTVKDLPIRKINDITKFVHQLRQFDAGFV